VLIELLTKRRRASVEDFTSLVVESIRMWSRDCYELRLVPLPGTAFIRYLN
jgi:hypothetical protein